MTKTSKFILCVVVVFAATVLSSPARCQSSKAGQSDVPHNVYIAPFTSRDPISPKLLASFRDLFEESFERVLARDGAYTVLNRETIEKVLSEAKYEAALTSVEQLNAALKGRLKIAKAEGFVFGEVTDDKESGDIVISAKLQGFNSVLYWNQSVTMRPGHVNDRSDRKDAIEQLVHLIEGSSEAEPSNSRRDVSVSSTSPSVKLFTYYSDKVKLRLCEEPVPNPALMGDCGFLTWNGTQYDAVWEGWTLLSEREFPQLPGRIKSPGGPILGTVKIERDGERGVILRRLDTTGISCVYHGGLSGANVASGTYVCELQGKAVSSGPWKLIPKP